ncbi:MAG: ribonuclease P protein component 1 [Candidatus Nanohaloarchaea archaeon]
MPRTAENLPKHELIGLEVEVAEHSDENLEGLEGAVVDETRNLLVIDGKKVSKKDGVFIFQLEDSRVEIDGELINKRPEDRLKMRIPEKFEGL